VSLWLINIVFLGVVPMMVRVENRKLFIGLLTALVALAWLGLWLWGESPYGRFLDHSQLSEITSEDASLLVFFVGGWTLMVFAMMLPTSLPLIVLFHTMTRNRPDHKWLLALLITGYIGVWVWFGVAVHLGDLALHEVAERNPWLTANSWAFGAGVLMLAGVYQFTPLKYHCLDKCRSPFSFIMQHWTGKDQLGQAFRLGLHHGVFCIGCCWSLMLLMFAAGTGNIGWMLVLGALMAVEKNMPWGRRMSKPLGVLLLAWGVALALVAWFLPF
jgi:predicted metal-binding membrane protein